MNNGACQVVSVGAGFDTLFWRLNQTGDAPNKYIELDFSEVTSKKAHYIQKSQSLLKAISHDGELIGTHIEDIFDRYISKMYDVLISRFLLKISCGGDCP